MTVVNTQLHDKINQVVLVGDLIVHYNNIYQVISLGKLSCRAKLIDPSPTTRPKTIYMHECINISKLVKDQNESGQSKEV